MAGVTRSALKNFPKQAHPHRKRSPENHMDLN
jgi:hypothetical protein